MAYEFCISSLLCNIRVAIFSFLRVARETIRVHGKNPRLNRSRLFAAPNCNSDDEQHNFNVQKNFLLLIFLNIYGVENFIVFLSFRIYVAKLGEMAENMCRMF